MIIEADGPGVVTLGAADRLAALAEVKAVLRIILDEEDAAIIAFVEASLGLSEQFTGQVWMMRAMTQLVARTGAWVRIDAAPVRSIGVVSAVAADGALTPLAIDAYGVDIAADSAGWVRVCAADASRAAVAFVAGVAEAWGAIPGPVRQGVVLLAAHLFERDAGHVPPAAVTALWRPFRRLHLMQPGGPGMRPC